MSSKSKDYETSVPCSSDTKDKLNGLKYKWKKRTLEEVLKELLKHGEIEW